MLAFRRLIFIFDSIDTLRQKGFIDFDTIDHLFQDASNVPRERGIYLVFYTLAERPRFLETGVGGHFKGRNPNVPIDELERKWLNGPITVYIGQAGGMRAGRFSDQTLSKRLRTYMRFGQGQAVGHWGGRHIWQIEGYKELLVCWRTCQDGQDPKLVEGALIQEFKTAYGKWPFANLQD